jgi:hypothetical protein
MRYETQCFKSAAVPATVSEEPKANSHWDFPGRQPKATIREPGDLPSDQKIRSSGGCPGQETST